MPRIKIKLFTLILLFSTFVHAGWIAKVSQGDREFKIEIPQEEQSEDEGIPVISINDLDHYWIAAALFTEPTQKLVFHLMDMVSGSTEGHLNFLVTPNTDSRYKFSLGNIAVELWFDSSVESPMP